MTPFTARRLYFLRHGQTEWNARGLFQGRSDIPLNDRGREQARAYAALMRDWFAARGQTPHFPAAVASPLSRASETCRIVLAELAAVPGAAVPAPEETILDPGLMEQHYGLWEGLTIVEIRRRFADAVERQFARMATFTAAGGEPRAAVMRRVGEAVRDQPDESLGVGHFGTLNAIMRLMWPDMPGFPKIPQDAFFILEEGRVTRVDAAHPEGCEMEH